MTSPSQAVFLSYASEDAEAAELIAKALKSAGIEVWFDKSELRGGDAWDRRIREQIHACRLFIPIISAHTEARDEGYFRREWKLAADRMDDMAGKVTFIFPVVIDGTPSGSAEVPERFRHVQWTRLPGGEMLLPLVERVRVLVFGHGAAQSTTQDRLVPQGLAAPAARVSVDATRRWKRIGYYGAIALSAIYVAGYFVYSRTRTQSAPTPAAQTTTKSIAVLPFVDLSEKHDQEYFADGMAEEILNLLARIPGLDVIGRTSSFQFKGRNEDLRAIGAQLNAAYVLEGSVRTSGDQVRVTAQLVNAATGVHEWSESYDRPIGDVLKLQDAVAAAVARQLELTVPPNAAAFRDTLKSTEAYRLALRAQRVLDRNDLEGFNEAAELLQKALQLDPTSAPTTSALAWTYELQSEYGFVPADVGFERARQAAWAALKLDEKDAGAHSVLARIHVVYDWDWPAADREYTRAAQLAPGGDFARDRSYLLLALGRWDEALADMKAITNLDPLSPGAQIVTSWIQARRGDLRAAEAAARRALDISPTYTFARYYLGLVLIARGNSAGALAEMEREVSDVVRINGLALAYQALGRKADADAALAHMLKEQAQGNPFGIAEVYAARGNVAEAVRWLERAYAQKDTSLFYVKGDLPFKGIERDPRYRGFLRKMNLPDSPTGP